MAVKLTSSRKGGVQDLFHRRSSGGGGSVSSRRSRSSISSSKRSSDKSSRRGRQSSNRSRRSRSRSRSRTRISSKQRQRRHRDENDNTNLIVNKSFEQKLTQDVESMSASQQRHLNSRRTNTNTSKQHRRRHTADSTTTKSTKSSSTAPTYCHDGIDLLFSDVISPLSGAICTFLTTCLCDDALIDNAGDNRDDRHLHRVSSPRVNRQMVNRRIPQRSRRDEKMLGSGSERRVSPTVNGVVLKQEEYNVLQPIEGAAVVVEEEEVIMYY